jgi:restriction endonuclease S subunit
MPETEVVATETVEATETPAEEKIEPKQEVAVETTETVEKKEDKPEDKEPEVKEPETPAKKEDEEQVDVEELLGQIKDKDEQVSTLTAQIKKEQKKVEALKEQVKTLEAVVSGLVEAKLKEIPEEFHALIPEGDSASKLAWITKAEETGIFKKSVTPNVEIGKPLTLGNPKERANDNLTAQQKLSNYFSQYFAKK